MSQQQQFINAAALGEEFRVEDMLKANQAEVNKGDPKGYTALHVAVGAGHTGVVAVLLKAGADPTQKTTGGDTALHIAATSGNAQLMNVLLSKKPNVEVKDRAGNTPLLAALDGEHESTGAVVAALLAGGASATTKNTSGRTALHLAAKAGNAEVVKLLLAHGADKNIKDNLGMSAKDFASDSSISALL